LGKSLKSRRKKKKSKKPVVLVVRFSETVKRREVAYPLWKWEENTKGQWPLDFAIVMSKRKLNAGNKKKERELNDYFWFLLFLFWQ
jgi:hypothetical protein